LLVDGGHDRSFHLTVSATAAGTRIQRADDG